MPRCQSQSSPRSASTTGKELGLRDEHRSDKTHMGFCGPIPEPGPFAPGSTFPKEGPSAGLHGQLCHSLVCKSAQAVYPPSSLSPKQCELPSHSLENLTVATGAEPAAGQGAGAVPTLVIIPPPSHCSASHTHIPTRAPLEHQLPLTPVSSPSATG